MNSENDLFESSATGTARRWDPLRVHRRLVHATGGQLGKLMEDACAKGEDDAESDTDETRQQKALSRMQADAKAFPATEKLLQAIAFAFEAEPFDARTGRGLIERRLQELFDDFCGYCAAVKKKQDSSVTSPAPTALPASSADASRPTKSSSDCGCSSTGSTTAAPPR
jgi:hypothetical protein